MSRKSLKGPLEWATMTPMLGTGVYTLVEAARLTGLKVARIKEWFRGSPVFSGTVPTIFEVAGGKALKVDRLSPTRP